MNAMAIAIVRLFHLPQYLKPRRHTEKYLKNIINNLDRHASVIRALQRLMKICSEIKTRYITYVLRALLNFAGLRH